LFATVQTSDPAYETRCFSLSEGTDGGMTVREIDLPLQGLSPYCNDTSEVVAGWLPWPDNVLWFRTGDRIFPKNVSARRDVDPSGTYFFFEDPAISAKVAKTSDPLTTLATLRGEGRTFSRIFFVGQEIYMLGTFFGRDEKGFSTTEGICVILHEVSDRLEVVREIHIPRRHASGVSAPYYPIDMDPSGKGVVFVDTRDIPLSFRGGCFYFDFDHQTLTKLRRCRGIPIFLQSDLLTALTE
jgi:hypothetical protein